MRDRPIIWLGLLIFLGLATFPIWRSLSAGTTTKGPEPVLPVREKQCVAPLDYMKTSHMSLLINWRDTKVRNNQGMFTAANGKTYTINLTTTCLQQCHTARADFCDRCHNYAGVSPTCWDCHLDSKQVVLRSAR